MAAGKREDREAESPAGVAAAVRTESVVARMPEDDAAPSVLRARVRVDGDSRPHLQIIPRPPARDLGNEDRHGHDLDDDSDGDVSAASSQSSNSDSSSTTTRPDQSVLLTLPSLESTNITRFELLALSLAVKCLRCKTTLDILDLSSSTTSPSSSFTPRTTPCPTCALPLALLFHSSPLIPNSPSSQVGALDLRNCTPHTLHPSVFTLTCSTCTTTNPLPAPSSTVRAAPAALAFAICRTCQARLTFHFPLFKFSRTAPPSQSTSTSLALATSSPLPLPRRLASRPRPGTPLPQHGACTHYARSLRWFRFPCCDATYPCALCHDESVGGDHRAENAERMVCGVCGREQRMSPDACAKCGARLVGVGSSMGGGGQGGGGGKGFWEGGKGTREPERMRRGEARKYRHRRGKVVPGAKGSGKGEKDKGGSGKDGHGREKVERE